MPVFIVFLYSVNCLISIREEVKIQNRLQSLRFYSLSTLTNPIIPTHNADMTGKVIAIFVAPTRHTEQISVDAVQLKAGKGIVGDRFFCLRHQQTLRNLTLIEWEVIEEFNRTFGLKLPLNATRRNLVTHGIRLNDLIGKTFKIGQVVCRGIELCEPCKVMARHFPATSLSQAEIIRAFANKGGIRVEVLIDGAVQLGDEVF
jgi:MOSC domain-containing protein YiiM